MTVQASILTIRTIAANTAEVTFYISGTPFSFVAGQYVTVIISGPEEAAVKERTHDFSIASSPVHTDRLSIAMRISESRFKRTLLSLPLGTRVTLEGPKGIFTLPNTEQGPLVFIAGGIGITPFSSMVRFSSESCLGYNITLLYFNASQESEVYGQELRLIAEKNNQFVLHEIVGLFSEKYIIRYVKDFPSMIWYVAGPPGMVALVRQALIKLGVLDTCIRTEEFTGYE